MLCTPQPYHDESLASYILRLSEANYYESPHWILQLVSCSANRVLKFALDRSKVTKLSQLTGIDDKLLQSKAFRAIRGHYFISYEVNQKATHLCPKCLKESSYARFLWDVDINRVCHIHRCNLVNKCPQCHQKIQWSRPGVTKCKCGFDFRDSAVTNATNSQVNFALYRVGCWGDAECMKLVKATYREDNPLFCLTFEQFEQLSNFLKFDIRICLSHKGNLAMSQDILTKFNSKSKLLSSEELVFDFFKDWKHNINYLFQWHEDNSLGKNSTRHTILAMVFRFVEFSSLLPVNCLLSTQLEIALRKYLYDYNVIQIEIAYRYSNDCYKEKLDLDRIEDWLPRLGGMLDCHELTLTRLIWVGQHIKSLRWLKGCSAWQIVLNRPLWKLFEFKSKFVTL
ncbi:TniQ family protein [Pleurocapsa sp. CCALA 161]|uniref:TniQ family protein n=1 Tax=Pleurocapsa sp. CCALA 161 TaxID=2107688 RepID=UPI001304F006|nr:TniQ family protein [Pleurocapsa sp. CCALA 161]